MDLLAVKIVHQLSAALSISGFVVRGGLMLADSALMQRRWMRVWPHFIDSTLLLSGIWMAYTLSLHPGNSPWLTAKLLALLVYIGLGFVALRLGRSKRARSVALLGALLCFAYIVIVARSHSAIFW